MLTYTLRLIYTRYNLILFTSDQVQATDGKWVAAAIKTLKEGSSDGDRLEFMEEARIMRDFNHANITRLLAFSASMQPILMVMEFMLHGECTMQLSVFGTLH